MISHEFTEEEKLVLTAIKKTTVPLEANVHLIDCLLTNIENLIELFLITTLKATLVPGKQVRKCKKPTVTIKRSRFLKYQEMKFLLPRQPSTQVKGAKLRRLNSVIYLKLNYSNVRYPNHLIHT